MPESRGGSGGKRRRGSTSAESGQTKEGGAEKITGSDDKDKLIMWKSFEEVEGIVQSYVTGVIDKALSRGYTSAKEVYDDYRIFHGLRTKLTNGQDELRVATYSAEYFYERALMEKASMLSTISSDDALQGDQRKWIDQQLELEEHVPKKLLKYASHRIKEVDASVSEMDKKFQNQIAEQNESKLKDLDEIRFRFQAGNFDVKVEVFEELKQKISSQKKLMDSLAQRCRTYYDTLHYAVGDISTLRFRLEFKRLLRDDEKELSLRWSELTQDVMKLSHDEKERLENAMLRSLMARS